MWRKGYIDRLLTLAFVIAILFIAGLTLLGVIGGALPMDRDDRPALLIIAALQSVLAFIIPAVFAVWTVSKKPLRVLRLDNPPSWRAVAGLVIVYIIALPALNQVIFWNAGIQFPASMETFGATLKEMEERAQDMANVMLATSSWVGLFVNLAIVAVLTAIGEEFFFRGAIQETAASNGAPHSAIWITAVIFSLMHFQVYGFVPRLILGAWFGYLLYWTNSLYVPIMAHALNNGVVVVCTWLSERGADYNFEMMGVSEYGFPLIAFISATATVVVLYYFKNYFFNRDTNLRPCLGGS